MDALKSEAQLTHEADIVSTKTRRRMLDLELQELKKVSCSKERAMAKDKLVEAIMWLGMDLKRLGETNPYPSSKDPATLTIEPTADGLKL